MDPLIFLLLAVVVIVLAALALSYRGRRRDGDALEREDELRREQDRALADDAAFGGRFGLRRQRTDADPRRRPPRR